MKRLIILLIVGLFTAPVFAQSNSSEAETTKRNSVKITVETLDQLREFDWEKTASFLNKLYADNEQDIAFTIAYEPQEKSQAKRGDMTFEAFSVTVKEESDPQVILKELRDGVEGMLALMEK